MIDAGKVEGNHRQQTLSTEELTPKQTLGEEQNALTPCEEETESNGWIISLRLSKWGNPIYIYIYDMYNKSHKGKNVNT